MTTHPPSLADPDMTDGALQARVADLPRNTILLLEDIDAAFISRSLSLFFSLICCLFFFEGLVFLYSAARIATEIFLTLLLSLLLS